MTPEEINAAIAEECGWRWVENPTTYIGGYWECGTRGEEGYRRGDWGSKECCMDYPDYFHDLNACHEMEKALTDVTQQYEYADWIETVAGSIEDGCSHPSSFSRIHATAPQRCEAFLKTKGRWR